MLDIVSESSRKRQETDRRKVAERELDHLNLKIDKLLLSLDDTKSVTRRRFRTEDECVVCLTAAATMQTFPCGHKVVCRKCLIKTMQVAVSKRCLPLRCVVCRDRILRLQNLSHYHTGTCSAVVPSPSLPSSFLPTAGHGGRPVSSPVALTYTFHNTRPSSSSLSPTSPTNVFSLMSSARYQNSVSRLLSPVSPPGVHSLPRLRTSISVPNNVPRVTHLIQNSLEEELLRCAPEVNKSCLCSHNDAVNSYKLTSNCEDKAHLDVDNKTTASHEHGSAAPQELKSPTPSKHRANVERVYRAETPEKVRPHTPQLTVAAAEKNTLVTEVDNKAYHKQNGHCQISSNRKADTPSHTFKHSQSAKIHPKSNDHLNSFLESPNDHGASSTTTQSPRVSSNSSSQNSVSASRFLARLFPKSSRRKCNWFRTE